MITILVSLAVIAAFAGAARAAGNTAAPRRAPILTALAVLLTVGVLRGVEAWSRSDGWSITAVWALCAVATAACVWSRPVRFTAPRIRLAAASTLIIVSIFTVHRLWPRWFGEDVYLAARVHAFGPNEARLEFLAGQVRLSGVAEESEWTRRYFTAVTPIGGIEHTPLRGRRVFVQMERSGAEMPDGSRAATAVSLSDAPVDGALNVSVQVVWTWEPRKGLLTLAYASRVFDPVMSPKGSVVPRNGELPARAFGHLKVLPSGRHAVVGVVSQ